MIRMEFTAMEKGAAQSKAVTMALIADWLRRDRCHASRAATISQKSDPLHAPETNTGSCCDGSTQPCSTRKTGVPRNRLASRAAMPANKDSFSAGKMSSVSAPVPDVPASANQLPWSPEANRAGSETCVRGLAIILAVNLTGQCVFRMKQG